MQFIRHLLLIDIGWYQISAYSCHSELEMKTDEHTNLLIALSYCSARTNSANNEQEVRSEKCIRSSDSELSKSVWMILILTYSQYL